MVITNKFLPVPESSSLIDMINEEVKCELQLKGENHCIMPQGNIRLLHERFPAFWGENRISVESSFVAGDDEIIQEIMVSMLQEGRSE